jgi:NO-binding membrane sensor protein with MHYT domain
VLQLHGFTDGPLIPGLGYIASCLGLFLGLRCATRARACAGPTRTRWLLLAGVSIGTAGIWAMGFIAMLGFAVSGETTRYNIPMTVISLLVAIAIAAAGLLIVGFGRDEARALPASGLAAGLGVTVVYVLAMAGMRMPGRLSYDPALFMLSVAIAVVASTAIMWGAARLHGTWATLGASLALGLALCGTHYTAMAAVRMSAAHVPAGLIAGDASGAAAGSFLLPVILGISVVVFLVWAAIALSPTEEAIRYDAELIDHIRQLSAIPLNSGAGPHRPARNGNGVTNGASPADGPSPWARQEVRGRPGPPSPT